MAIAVCGLSSDSREGLVIARRRNAFVSPQALAHVGNIAFRNRDIDSEVDRHAGFVFDLLAAQFCDSALEHLRVKIKTERVHVARLLAAEKISRAAQLQIQSGNSEAGAKIRELANRCQPPARDWRQLLFRRNQQVSVSPSIRSTHASAQL